MMPTEFVDPGWARSGMVWCVNYRKEISEGELYVVVLTEFQSTVDRDMPLRMVKYTVQIYTKLLEERRSPGQKLPPVLPVVVYSGEAPWSAPEEMEETVAPVGEELLPFQLRQRYFLLDLRRVGVDDALLDNVLYVQASAGPVGGSAVGAVEVAGRDRRPKKLFLVMELTQQAAEGSGAVDDKVLAQLETHRTKGELGAIVVGPADGRGYRREPRPGIDRGQGAAADDAVALGVAEGGHGRALRGAAGGCRRSRPSCRDRRSRDRQRR